MKTTHELHCADSRNMKMLSDDSVELVVTSPPYPMIEMWDDAFSSMDNTIRKKLDNGYGEKAFEKMHQILDDVWEEVNRVTTDDAIICINIGDATRKIGGSFQLFPNHSRIISWFTNNGFEQIPSILWRKPTNSAAKFMGSGMRPPNQYVTLEHEHILIFRKDGTRTISEKMKRDRSAYFWEERNTWFSDVWEDIVGTPQEIESTNRERAAAFPLEIPYRLINMYSVYEDTVLDPFAGTGTTLFASMASSRSSICIDKEKSFIQHIKNNIDKIPQLATRKIEERLESHKKYMKESNRSPDYTMENYNIPVITKQEKDLQFYEISKIQKENSKYTVTYHPYQKT